MADSPEFRFRALDLPGDLPELRPLLALGFPETVGRPENTAEFLTWKFSRSSGGQLSEIGFLHGERGTRRAASFYGVIPIDYALGGERATLGLVCDVMSHPEIRRQGLFTKAGFSAMERLEHTAVAAVLGYPVRDDVMPGHLRVGWKPHFRLPVYVAPVTAPAGGPMPLRLGLRAAGSLARILRSRRRASDVSFVSAAEFIDSREPARLARSAAAGGLRIAVREDDFLRWRLGRPGASYVHVIARGRTGTACAVARLTELRGVSSLAVLDLMSDDLRATGALVDALWRDAREAGAGLLALCVNAGTARRLRLGRFGFVRSPLSFRLIARPTGPTLSSALFDDDRAWHLSWLDSDTL